MTFEQWFEKEYGYPYQPGGEESESYDFAVAAYNAWHAAKKGE